MEHEAVFELASQRVDALCIALGAQSGDDQSLGFTTGEQGRAVGAGQHAVADFDGAHSACVAAINAGLTGQNLAAHDARFNFEQQVIEFDRVKRHTLFGQSDFDRSIGFAASMRAGLLVADLVSGTQLFFGKCCQLGFESRVTGRRLPVPNRLACIAHQFVDRVDGNGRLLVAIHHATQHDFFGQLQGFGFDHQHSSFGASHHQVHQTVFALGLAWVQDVFAIDVAHASGANRAVERDARDGQGGRNRDHRGDVGVNFRVERHGVDDHVHVVVETFGEQRADWSVNQAAGQGFVLAGLGFTLEEAAWDLACGVGFLDVIDRQREEVLTGLGDLGTHNRGQHHGAVHVEQHSAAGLASDFAGFHLDRVLAPLECFGDFIENGHVQNS